MGLFGKSPERNPREQVREWTSKIRKEGYQLDRQIRAIQREEEKAKRAIKDAVKKGNKEVCPILAKEIVRSRRAIRRIYASKAQLNSVIMNMNQQVATMRMAGSIQKSTEVLKSMQSLVKMPEIAQTMQELSKEMTKAGIIEEMMEDIIEGDEEDELEDEAQAEVDKVLWEITAGQLGTAPPAVDNPLPTTSIATPSVPEEDKELDNIEERLTALRS